MTTDPVPPMTARETESDEAFVERMAKRWEPHKHSSAQGGTDIWRLIGLVVLARALQSVDPRDGRRPTPDAGGPFDALIEERGALLKFILENPGHLDAQIDWERIKEIDAEFSKTFAMPTHYAPAGGMPEQRVPLTGLNAFAREANFICEHGVQDRMDLVCRHCAEDRLRAYVARKECEPSDGMVERKPLDKPEGFCWYGIERCTLPHCDCSELSEAADAKRP